MGDPRATYLEDEYVFVWDDLDVELTFERFREERGELRADAQPKSAAGKGYLPGEKLNLTSARSIKQYANTLGGYGLLDADAWFAALSTACRMAAQRYRSGAPAVRLSDVEWEGAASFIYGPYIEARGTTLWFGDGGASKSLHALTAAVCVATGIAALPGGVPLVTGSVGYLDWEADAQTHAMRLAAICQGLQIDIPKNIIYMYRSASLSESVREVRRVIAYEGIVFNIVDSIGAAAGGDPERAETIIRVMNAIRALEVPTLGIHHVTKDQKDKSKPFGSVYSPNLARLTWRMDKEQDEGSDLVRVRWTNFKGNNVGLLNSRGHGVRFINEGEGWDRRLVEVDFTEVSGSELPATNRNSQKWQLASYLQSVGSATTETIAAALDLKPNLVRAQFSRHKDFFVRNGEEWALLDDQRNTVAQHPATPVARNATHPPPIGAVLQPTAAPFDEEDEQGRLDSLAGL